MTDIGFSTFVIFFSLVAGKLLSLESTWSQLGVNWSQLGLNMFFSFPGGKGKDKE